jgi:hypothetical protein
LASFPARSVPDTLFLYSPRISPFYCAPAQVCLLLPPCSPAWRAHHARQLPTKRCP